MPSRSIVRRAARAVGTTSQPSASSSTSTGVAIASISGTTSSSAHGRARSASSSVAQRLRVGHVDDGARSATCIAGAPA